MCTSLLEQGLKCDYDLRPLMVVLLVQARGPLSVLPIMELSLASTVAGFCTYFWL